ncbi:ABC transporter ATP-binding protein [Caproiciproducens galactitolivorans]|uniref:ABC transporter ATP-binding protein n=1 Tax=Caproiciproducens galactitolivorans TaxID=642589 RepID=A0ABT4BR22_9FIRM|nr:ABC transporter ATP-binding protein [Caproiciproducens galactitolivorans]MCY1713341.1 ABC transporter ATP-binding protein [Caproiciproducens galactitolivorans]
MKPFLAIRNVSKIYSRGNGEVRALDGVSLSVQPGEFLAIVGRSGSGKSTLMNILGCLDTPTNGDYFLDGENVAGLNEKKLAEIRNRELGFVFQGFNLISGMDAVENVELPLLYRGIPAARRRSLALNALDRVGLSERVNHMPDEMSGGQQQRVAIARAIAAEPPLILADEPTGNLDSKSGEAIMQIIHSLHKQGTTIVLITHDNKIAASAERVVQIQDGRMVH